MTDNAGRGNDTAYPLSAAAYQRALRCLPGGVDSPVRAATAVGGDPLFIARGSGSRIWDIDGNAYIDYVCSWGPLILGHAHPEVVAALATAAERGTSFGAPTEMETELAEEVLAAYPSMDMLRMVNSGTEATMSALRLARAVTSRDLVVKFEGAYHGHADSLLVKSGSGALTLGVPDSPGVPPAVAELTLTARYNDLESVRELFIGQGERIASVIVEPVAGNMGVVLPRVGFLRGLRELTREYGSLLIFDEVMTGFRVAYGGAQQRFGIDPDLTCLGKIIGGGLPTAAYGGKRRFMEMVAPAGPVYQAGTLAGNPLATAGGLTTIRALRRPGVYERLESQTEKLAAGIRALAAKAGLPVQVNAIGGMLSVFFAEREVTDYQSARASDQGRFARWYRLLLADGVYLPPSQYEALFMSLAHSQNDIEQTLAQMGQALSHLNHLNNLNHL